MHFQRFGDALQRLPHISNVTAIAVSMHQQHLELGEFQEIVGPKNVAQLLYFQLPLRPDLQAAKEVFPQNG